MAERVYRGKALGYVYISESMKEATESVGSAANSASTGAFLLVMGLSVLQTAVMGGLWVFVNTLQFLSYLPLINCYVPYCLQQFLTEHMSIKGVTIPFQILPDFLLTPLEAFAAFATEPFNDRLLLNGYEGLSFLYNFAEELITWLAMLFLYVLLKLLTIFISKDK
eukprot:TRINITY_DN2835_c0_g2_i3.p1 TRINITY_DN2835_c0_g2~~TRINITY_DN2835_c0_g2_i3.p1  ORF type:complete len:166 (+),score=40.36 TRINITY_DN2835_c0_g2_i3:196-693(+)